MKSRFELLDIYRNFAKMVETQFSKRIKDFRSDNALEYTQQAFQNILKHYSTAPHLSCPGTSRQNGRAERKLRHILDTVRALLLSSLVPTHERLFGSSPTYHQLRVFGSACFVLL